MNNTKRTLNNNNIKEAVDALAYETELEELNFFNFELRDKASEFLRSKGALFQNNGNDHAFRKMHGLGSYWFVFVDVDCQESYKIHVVVFQTVGLGIEEIKWSDVNVLDAEDNAWKDIPKYLEERYSIIVHPVNEQERR